MNDERVEELMFTISGKLSSIEAKLSSMQETLIRHESRITCIEDKIVNCYVNNKNNKNNNNDSSLKDQLLALLAKSVVIALTALATLAGAGSMLPKISAM